LPDVIYDFARQLRVSPCEAERIQARHADFFRDLAETSELSLSGSHQRATLDKLEMEVNNLRAALGWALESRHTDHALRLASALWSFWETRGYISEGRDWLERALSASSDVLPIVRARALTAAAALAEAQGDFASAEELNLQALPLWRTSADQRGLAGTL